MLSGFYQKYSGPLTTALRHCFQSWYISIYISTVSMKVTVVFLELDQTFSLDVQDDLSLENFRALCSMELNIAAELILLIFNGKMLVNYKDTLQASGVADNDMILVQRGAVASDTMNAGSIPKIDFASIRVPGHSPTGPGPSSRPVAGGVDLTDPEVIRQRLLHSPHDLALLRERNPALAVAVLKGGEAFAKELEKIREAQSSAEREKIRMLNADPLDPEVQNKIAEDIRRQNIQDNMNMAIEETPESFGQVVMLWINIKVNGYFVKAFVDSGAQMTIMSATCAERCHIMRLVDRRWEGVAKGVGTQKIIGRIHLAQMQIENDFLQCSFSVLEDQPMDVLLGLDMLRRHQCCIDLKENKLRIGTTGTETSFLNESELPTHGRLHGSDKELGTESEDERITRALKASAEETNEDYGKKHAVHNPGLLSGRDPVGPSTSNAAGAQANLAFEASIKKLTDMGFDRNTAEKELAKCNGDTQYALMKLLARSLKTD